jgi:hypothetical protein
MRSIKNIFLNLIFSLLGLYSFAQKDSIQRKIDSLETQLQEVKITTKKKIFEQKVDRLVFNVENSNASQGISGLELMNYVPLINVSNDQLSLVGKSGLGLMVNGKLVQTDIKQFLQNLRSENIEKVEVITSPSAKYDAEGNSGLINIVLKKNKNLGWNGTIGNTYEQRTYAGNFPYLNLKYKSKRLDVSSSFWYNYSEKLSDTTIEYDYFNNQKRKDDGERKDLFQNYGAYLNMNYIVNSKWDLGIIYDGSNSFINQDSNFNTYFHDYTTMINSSILSLTNQERKSATHSINLYSDHLLSESGKKINFSINYINRDFNQDNYLNSMLYKGNFNLLENNIQANNPSDGNYKLFVSMVDFIFPLKFIKLEYGGKYTHIKNDSRLKFYDIIANQKVLNTQISNDFNFNEDIFALYMSANKKINDKWTIQAGLRYEQAKIKGFSPTLNQENIILLKNLFPSVHFNYQPKENHTFNLSYTKRINRPALYEINPFRTYLNNFFYSEGNPNLLPVLTHNIDFTYMYKNNLRLNLYYARTLDSKNWVTFTDSQTQLISSTILNYLNENSFGLTTTYNLSWKKYNNFITLNGYYNKAKSDIPTITIADFSGYGYSFSTRNSYSVSKKTSITFDYSHSFPSVFALTQRKDYASFNLGFKTSFLDNNLNLNCSVNDIFKQAINNSRTQYLSFINHTQIYNDMRHFSISITYNFGNHLLKNKEKRIRIDDKSRLSQ